MENKKKLAMAEEIEEYIKKNKVTFSDADISAITSIVCLGCASSYTINVPSASDISSIDKATHTLNLPVVSSIISAYEINQAKEEDHEK